MAKEGKEVKSQFLPQIVNIPTLGPWDAVVMATFEKTAPQSSLTEEEELV